MKRMAAPGFFIAQLEPYQKYGRIIVNEGADTMIGTVEVAPRIRGPIPDIDLSQITSVHDLLRTFNNRPFIDHPDLSPGTQILMKAYTEHDLFIEAIDPYTRLTAPGRYLCSTSGVLAVIEPDDAPVS